MLLLIVSCTAYARLLSFILVYLLNIKQLIKAFMIGSTVGILVAIMTDSYWFATSHFYSNYTVMFLDIIAAGISVGVLGLVIALTNKKLVLENNSAASCFRPMIKNNTHCLTPRHFFLFTKCSFIFYFININGGIWHFTCCAIGINFYSTNFFRSIHRCIC